jgi:hypothetical protein
MIKATQRLVTLFLLLILSYVAVGQTTVYVTSTGEKYHKSGCQYLSKSKIDIDLAKAQKDGYTACSVCKPSGKTNQLKTSTGSQKSTNQQCTGTTKSGARCKRMTTNVSGKCYQH